MPNLDRFSDDERDRFDPYRDTQTSADEEVGPDPFADYPTRSLNDPMGELAGYGQLARGLAKVPGGVKRTVGFVMVALILVPIIVAVVLNLLGLLG